MKILKRLFIVFLTVLIVFPSISYAVGTSKEMGGDSVQKTKVSLGLKEYYTGKVISVKISPSEKLSSLDGNSKKMEVLITSGDRNGETVFIEESTDIDSVFHNDYQEGDSVFLYLHKLGTIEKFVIFDYYRMTWAYYLSALFVIVLFVIGRKAGIKALISMIISILSVVIMIPLIYLGLKPIILAVVIGSINTILTILLVAGKTKKSFSSIVGTISGIIISFAIAYFVGQKTYITGISPEEAGILKFIPNINIKPRDLLYAGVLFGSLGAVMDVAMSISSAIEEVSNANENLRFKELYTSGMNVGRDVMGTMTNTLVLAYLSSSLPLLVIVYSYNASLPVFYNMDIIVSEIVRTLAGSIGIIVSIPITCAVAALLMKEREY